jgi:hypothetical protein
VATELPPREHAESPRLATILEYVGRVLAPAAGLTYFLGFLVVNFHLARYGVNFLGVFAPQYLTAGLWALYPFLAGLGLSAMAQEPLRWDRNPIRWRRILTNIFLGLVLGIGFVAALMAPLWLLVDENFSDQPRTVGAVLSLIAWLGAALFGLWLGQPGQFRREEQHPRGFRIYIFYGLLALAVIVGYCRLFVLAYESVPARWGGGREVRAKLLLNPGFSARFGGLKGFDRDTAGVTVRLALVTDNILLIVPPTGDAPAVVIKRQDVDGIILEGKP